MICHGVSRRAGSQHFEQLTWHLQAAAQQLRGSGTLLPEQSQLQ
jgi:hypothetical protein